MMTLDQAEKGQRIEIIRIPDQKVRVQAIRFGIAEGSKLICSEKIPGGPVILQNRMQEIAIGRNLARQIEIEPA